jgi:aspartate/methionine/tyrosine aminotransferase
VVGLGKTAGRSGVALKQSKRGSIPPFIVMDVMRAANAREIARGDVIHLEVGQPSTPAPAGVLAAAERALRADKLGYTDAFGIPPLRRAIGAHYRAWYGVDVPAERIVVTTGSSGAFLLAFTAAFDAGDRVAIVEPGYPCYKNILRALDIEVVSLPGSAATRYQPSVELLEKHGGRLDGLIVASPSNPTGTMLSPEDLASLAGYCRARGIRLVSDEIYHGITYGNVKQSTAAALDGGALVINSFSKYFSMTGWRLGWMVVPPDLLRPVECLAQNFFISPPAISQHAALAAFDCRDELEGNVARYAKNRAHLLAHLPKAGFDRLAPSDGAFYIYAEIGHLTNDSQDFCRRMLDETGVATTPGVDFDRGRGSTTLRISFAGSEADMAEATRRLETWRR